MRNIVTVQQMQALDKKAIRYFGIPSISLMENAGCSVAREIIQALKKNKSAMVCIFCGLGNNAGDGFVAARHLFISGIKTKVYVAGNPVCLKSEALTYYNAIKKLKMPVKNIQKINAEIIKDIKKARIVVDALFGTGLTREIKEPYKNIIEMINEYSRYTISIDIPSGIDGTTGKILGVCIKAKKTITFVKAKTGFYNANGPKHTGIIKVVNIGIPA